MKSARSRSSTLINLSRRIQANSPCLIHPYTVSLRTLSTSETSLTVINCILFPFVYVFPPVIPGFFDRAPRLKPRRTTLRSNTNIFLKRKGHSNPLLLSCIIQVIVMKFQVLHNIFGFPHFPQLLLFVY